MPTPMVVGSFDLIRGIHAIATSNDLTRTVVKDRENPVEAWSFDAVAGSVPWQLKLGSTLRMKIYIQLERLHMNNSGNYGSNRKVRICGFDQIVFFW